MRKIALLFLDTFLDANFNFLVFLGRPGRDPGQDPSWVMTPLEAELKVKNQKFLNI